MTRTEMVNYLYKSLCESKNWCDVRKAFSECCDWNIDHCDEEIFMSECDDNTITIEDDYFSFDF